MELELERLAREIKKRKAKKTAIQLPEGLKTRTLKIGEYLEKRAGCRVITIADPCFGSCDAREKEAKELGADLLVHFGHAPIGKHAKTTIFWPIEMSFDAAKTAERIAGECRKRNWGTIGLGTTVQYAGGIEKVRKELAERGIKPLVGKGSRRTACKGQVLGCNYSAARRTASRADGLFFIGDGLFHALGMALSTEKETIALNPLTLNAKSLEGEKEKFYKKRVAMASLAGKAKTFGIIVSTKSGQMQTEKAERARKLVETTGKKAVVLAMDFVRPEYLEGIEAECFVCTACPRIAYDDSTLFRKPIITLGELGAALGKESPEKIRFEEIE